MNLHILKQQLTAHQNRVSTLLAESKKIALLYAQYKESEQRLANLLSKTIDFDNITFLAFQLDNEEKLLQDLDNKLSAALNAFNTVAKNAATEIVLDAMPNSNSPTPPIPSKEVEVQATQPIPNAEASTTPPTTYGEVPTTPPTNNEEVQATLPKKETTEPFETQTYYAPTSYKAIEVGFFDEGDLDSSPDMCLYQIDVKSLRNATFRITDDDMEQESAIAAPNNMHLFCEYDTPPNPTLHKAIENVHDGMLEKENNVWNVVKKAKIKFI